MRIALLGYGQMGKAVEAAAQKRGHQICAALGGKQLKSFDAAQLEHCEVAIEFTHAHIAPEIIPLVLQSGVPVVSGTTGWNQELTLLQEKLEVSGHPAFLHASNFSVGVNLFFKINKVIAELMAGYPEYIPTITEIHHTAKKDAPSGTAISIAEGLLTARQDLHGWALSEDAQQGTLSIEAIREGTVPGTHTVRYTGTGDEILLTHQAFNRDGFAQGAVLAAEFVLGKQGIFSMQDVLGV